MKIGSLDRVLAILATLAALTVAGMVVAILLTGGSQDFFQTARSLEAYGGYLAIPLVALGLRLNLGLDNLFMIFYGAFFIVLAVRLRDMLDPRLLGTAVAAVMLTLVLDSIENHHIMTNGALDPERTAGLRRRRPASDGRLAGQVSQQLPGGLAVLVRLPAIRTARPDHCGRALVLHSLRRADFSDAG
jgi:hypothetical protein